MLSRGRIRSNGDECAQRIRKNKTN
jgi:hypothetical protein